MAFKSKDGKSFSNKDTQRTHDAMTSAPPPPAADPGAQAGPPPIQSDPEAMQCVQILQQKGYTADDVEQAMGGGDDQMQGGGMPPSEMGGM